MPATKFVVVTGRSLSLTPLFSGHADRAAFPELGSARTRAQMARGPIFPHDHEIVATFSAV